MGHSSYEGLQYKMGHSSYEGLKYKMGHSLYEESRINTKLQNTGSRNIS